MSAENTDGQFPVEVFRVEPIRPAWHWDEWIPEPHPYRSLAIAIGLFVVTGFSTLAAGAQFAAAYAAGQAPAFDNFFTSYFQPFAHPRLFLPGLPFAVTLLGILLAHELGHYFACRYYHIRATYPFFVPAPTLIGTLGAFIRIRSPILNRRALFDMALAGPLVGFLLAVPALALAIAQSKVIAAAQAEQAFVFGQPLIERLARSYYYAPACHTRICCCLRWGARLGWACSRRR